MAACWDIAPCSLVEGDRRFRDAYCQHHLSDETSVYFYETTRRYIPESCHLQTRRRENLKCHIFDFYSTVLLSVTDTIEGVTDVTHSNALHFRYQV
jgi:hypothetical protein